VNKRELKTVYSTSHKNYHNFTKIMLAPATQSSYTFGNIDYDVENDGAGTISGFNDSSSA
jgi:hypothetical protein